MFELLLAQKQKEEGVSKLIHPYYNEDIKFKKFRFYIYTGDNLGYIKLWDFSALLESFGYDKVRPFN